MLLEFIGEQGLRLPKELRTSLQRTPLYRTSTTSAGHSGEASTSASTKSRLSSTTGGMTGSSVAMDVMRGKSPGHRDRNKYQGERGYAEEVDVHMTDAVSTHSLARTSSSVSAAAAGPGRAATPTARSSARLSATSGSAYQPGEVFNRQSTNLKAGTKVADMVTHSANVASSWARSSRSSHGSASRYDGADEEEDSHGGDLANARARSSSGDAYPSTSASANGLNKSNSQRGGPPALASGSSNQSQDQARISASAGAVRTSSPRSSATSSASTSTAAVPAPVGVAGTRTTEPTTGRVEETLPDGKKIVRYKNGTEKEVDEAGNSVVRFLNGDTKSVNVISGVVVYYYAQAETTHTTFKDGLEVYEFPNKQVRVIILSYIVYYLLFIVFTL